MTLYRSEVCNREAKQMLWYAMVVSHPPEVCQYLKRSSSTLLVAEMASCDLSQESAVLRTLRGTRNESSSSSMSYPRLCLIRGTADV